MAERTTLLERLTGTLEHMLLPSPILALAEPLDCLVDSDLRGAAVSEWEGRQMCFFSGEGQSGGEYFYHEPVLVEEVMAVLKPEAGKVILDGTLGGGGHAQRMLEAGARVVGMDRDDDALEFAGRRLEGFGDGFRLVKGNFAEMGEVVEPASLDGVLLDLGVSSWQLDEADRGFSFQKDGPLDMRMDRSKGETAADVVNGRDEAELAKIFWEFGEEKASRKIAAAVVKGRPFTRTLELAQCVEKAMGGRGRKHPATRVFQALRMAVNSELDSVLAGLDAATRVLKPGGMLAVITFHSLEDRLVKRYLREASREYLDRPEWPAPRKNEEQTYELITRKAVAATKEELNANPRSRSAKLRSAKRV